MAKTGNRQLGELLRLRRERLSPADCGLPYTQRRRTPGLRRDEVAERAGISVDWYTRLEQGRDSRPSKATVDALAKALRLDPADRAHLLGLALGHTQRPFKFEPVPPHLSKLMEEMKMPAYILNPRCDLLCWNRAAVELFRDFAKIPAAERNTLYQMFTAPEMATRYPRWEEEARGMLESFRATYDHWSNTPQFNELVSNLSARSTEFRRWWKDHRVRQKPSGEKTMRHPKLGLIRMSYATFQSNDNPNLKLVIYGKPQPLGRRSK